MATSAARLTFDDVTSVTPTYAVVDGSIYGAMMGLVIYMARQAQIESETSLTVVDANIAASKYLGELNAKLSELHGLLDKPTDTVAGLPAYKQPRALVLMYDINALSVKCRRGIRLDGSGNPVGMTPDQVKEVNPLFGSSERTGLGAERGDPDQLAKAWTDTETAWLNAMVVQTESGTQANVDQWRVGILADYLKSPPFAAALKSHLASLSDPPPVYLPDSQAAGLAFLQGFTNGVSNAKLYLDAFIAEYPNLLAVGGRPMESAVGMMEALNNGYMDKLRAVPVFNVKYGILPSDDGTALNGAMILVQSDSDALSLETNKSMNAASNKVQLSSGYFDAGKGTLDQQERLGRAMINF